MHSYAGMLPGFREMLRGFELTLKVTVQSLQHFHKPIYFFRVGIFHF